MDQYWRFVGRLKTQVRKRKVPEDGICKYGKRKYESATVENVSRPTFEEFTIFQSCIFSRSAVSRWQFRHSSPVLYQSGVIHKKSNSCWTHAQKGLGSKIAGATLSSNSLRQTVYTHCTSVHQAAKLVAALLRVARVTAGLTESNGSLPPGLWLTSPTGWLPRTGISSGTFRSAIEYWLPLLFYFWLFTLSQKKSNL